MAAQSADPAENYLTAEKFSVGSCHTSDSPWNYIRHVKRWEGMAGDSTSAVWVRKNRHVQGIIHLFYFGPHSEDGLCNSDSVDFTDEPICPTVL